MNRLHGQGGSVLEQLSQPCDSFGRSAAFLNTYVKGEYEDEDGDWATEFIFADPKPSAKPHISSCARRREYGNLEQIFAVSFPDTTYRHGSGKEVEANPLSMDLGKISENDSEFMFRFPCNDRHPMVGPEVSNYSSVDHNCSCSENDMGYGGSRNSRRSASSSESDVERIEMEDADRKLRHDSESPSYITDQSEGSFTCESCGETLPLTFMFPMLNCHCLHCNSCCRRHVESSLDVASKISIHGKLLAPKQHDLPTRVQLANSVSVERKVLSRDGLGYPIVGNNVTSYRDVDFDATTDEHGPELHVESFSEQAESCLESISCPTPSCSGCLQLSEARSLALESFQKWEEAASRNLMEQCTSFINCPGCDIIIEKVASELPPGVAFSGVPELDRTLPFIELDYEGKPLSRLALCHRAEHRFRCPKCFVDFCGHCKTAPYHLGKTCDEFEEEKNSIKCLYCEAHVRPRGQDEVWSTTSVRELQKELESNDVDVLWCMEKKELIAVQRFASSVCQSKECRKLLQMACTRDLECGHHCGGVRGERQCLDCLKDDCRQKVALQGGSWSLPSADDLCPICMVVPLHRAPAIQLKCGHVVHFCCAQKKLEQGFPGPAISFWYLNCPLCPEQMQHPSLDQYLQRPLELFQQVRKNAVTRLKIEGVFGSAKELKAGGRYEGKPADFALQLYQYYICCKCRSPYFGGLRQCRANERELIGNAHNNLNLICGGCSASSKGQGLCTKGHGREFVEFKCKFCCSIATYFCFGHTHFCENCHNTRPDWSTNFTPLPCRGPEQCPLRVYHAPNGQECCLGCAMCRLQGQ